jgi:hypothetical protein
LAVELPEIFEVDLDLEKIKVDDTWFTAGDLARAIKERIDAGDYRVSRLSEALERLRGVVERSQDLRVRVTGEVAVDFRKIANRLRVPLQRVLRDALTMWLTSEEASELLFADESRARILLLERPKHERTGDVRLTSSPLEKDWFSTPPKHSEDE